MNFKSSFFILLVFALLSNCKDLDPNQQIDEGNIENNVYVSNEIGWTMTIPEGWDIVTMDETKAYQKKGTDILEDMIEEDYDMSQLRNLLSFKKNRFNLFQSTSEPYEIEYEGEWDDNNIALKELLIDAFKAQGITLTSTPISTELIDGVEFKHYEFTMYDTDDTIILNQMIYATWKDGYDFGVNITYNNEDDKNEMLSAFRNSKFTKVKPKA